MNAEFNWWLLIVGLVFGAGLVYLVLADSSRRESEVAAEEVPREAAWIAATLRSEGTPVAPEIAERVLLLHREYLASPPPDEVEDEDEDEDEADEAIPDEGATSPPATIRDRAGDDTGRVAPAARRAPPPARSLGRDDPHVQRH
jgi:hypothetical protein